MFSNIFKYLSYFILTSIFLLNNISLSNAKSNMVVEADESIEWNQEEGYYIAKGKAVAKHGDSYISANVLLAYYNPIISSREIVKIVANGDVKFSDNLHSGTAFSATYDLVNETYELKGPNALINGPEGSTLAKSKITYDKNKRIINLIEKGKINLKNGRKLDAEKIEIILDKNDKFVQINAVGNVKVVQKSGSVATSEFANYDKNSDIAILTQSVEIRDGFNFLRGEKAEINFTSGISKILPNEKGGKVVGTFSKNKWF